MAADCHNSSSPLAPAGAEVRRTGRLRCNMLECTLGDVIDISAAGMRVRHKGSPRFAVGECIALSLVFASAEVRLETRVVWMRRTGFRRHEIGLEFSRLDSQTRDGLVEIARCATKLANFRPEAA